MVEAIKKLVYVATMRALDVRVKTNINVVCAMQEGFLNEPGILRESIKKYSKIVQLRWLNKHGINQ